MDICSDCFLPKTLIHLWNFSETNFFASASDFAASSSSFQIFYSSTIFFTSIIFFSAFFSLFFPASSFCFCHPSFPCFGLYYFLHSSRHLVIFTSSIFQLISELWRASHSIPKITFHFCPPITSISVLSLYSW